MCGIVGYAGVSGGMGTDTLLACRDALAHRGPDGAGHWVSDDGRVAFGHRRLAIVDLSPTGEQPMHWASPRLTVTFNGEIYNHGDLRGELAARGHPFRGHSDTEVILAAVAEWGTGALQRLRGMFAFALYDHARRRLILARDRAGEKPLFWARHRRGVVFSSELKALFADPAFPRRIDMAGLNAYLAFGYVPADQCLLQEVRKIPPGHFLELDLESGDAVAHRYWHLPEPAAVGAEREPELVDELHDLLKASVREQLQADVPVAVLLSGGTDSSLITACAAAVSGAPIQTFTLGFPGEPRFDERRFARRIASHFGTRHMEVEAEVQSLDLLPALAGHFDEPIADSSMIPTFLVSRLVSRHGKVVLGGDGGDELFGGYRAYQGALRVEGARRTWPRALRSTVAGASELLPVGFPGRNALTGLGGSLTDGVARVGVMFDAELRRQLVPALRHGHGVEAPDAWKAGLVEPSRGVPGAYMAADFNSLLPGDLLVKVDRAAMANSLEVRAPFLDHRIIEFAFGKVPNALRASRRERKILLRRLASRVLPPQFDAGRKQGFSIPLTGWMTPRYRAAWCDRFEPGYRHLFDFSVIRRLLGAAHLGGVSRVFGLVFLLHWMETCGISE
jgi:asparagine synthase (glutamine-hydrolysing)